MPVDAFAHSLLLVAPAMLCIPVARGILESRRLVRTGTAVREWRHETAVTRSYRDRKIALVRVPSLARALAITLWVGTRTVVAIGFCDEVDARVRDFILAHEASHARHGDPLRLLLARVLPGAVAVAAALTLGLRSADAWTGAGIVIVVVVAAALANVYVVEKRLRPAFERRADDEAARVVGLDATRAAFVMLRHHAGVSPFPRSVLDGLERRAARLPIPTE